MINTIKQWKNEHQENLKRYKDRIDKIYYIEKELKYLNELIKDSENKNESKDINNSIKALQSIRNNFYK